MKYQIILAVCIGFVMSGCVSSPEPNLPNLAVSGETKADEILANDAAEAIKKHLAAQDCADITTIESKIIKVHSMDPDKYKIQEKWSAHGCEKTFNYSVLFTPNGNGGTKYTLTPL